MSTTPLYLRWLWWKHTWTFQGAHKPLCGRFHRDVIRMGPVRVCRSCSALYGSLALTLLAAPAYYGQLDAHAIAAASGALLGVVAASAPGVYQHVPRRGRDLLRSGLGILIGLVVVTLFTPLRFWAWGELALLAVAWQVYHRQRDRHRDEQDLCAGCPERGRPGICSGFAEQAVRLRAYEEAATDWLECRVTSPAEEPLCRG